ncbi:YetF domain-containing protein [Pedobacter agri]|uniref:YetF domain-containing protein n=1 Tax=Pedobacter agri TaxID=454586 RepID=UPI002930B535|nr:YetF domain-containing protein [Pedobacter agri]
MAAINWQDVFLLDLNWSLTLEITVRTFIMFVLVMIFLRSTGKKGVRQLSIFEVAIIIALGSAAGDPMLNSESAIIPSLLVFVVILITYRLITYLAAKNQRVENILEGVPMYIIEDGKFTLTEEGDGNFAKDEFFAEIRAQGIEHLGQVKAALLETNGQVSFLFRDDEEVGYGLPVFPKAYSKKSKNISEPMVYACTHCGHTTELSAPSSCERCGKDEWVAACNNKRVS